MDDHMSRADVGGKAAGLRVLEDAGCRVPDWAVVEVAHHRADRGEGPLAEPTRATLASIARDLGPGPVAVRSSATVEDAPDRSWAGAFMTMLGVRTDQGTSPLEEALRRCWSSAHAAGIDAGMAVVVQRMISPRASGVVFTGAAYDSPDTLLVSAVPGLGEGLVSGAVDADVTLVDQEGRVLRERIGDKTTAARPSPDGTGVRYVEVPVPDRADPVLSEAELAELTRQVALVPDPYGHGLDLEFAVDETGVWMLQARPVTATVPRPLLPVRPDPLDVVRAEPVPSGVERIWDNSNIIESFHGPTSPLTFSTAAWVYARVYDGYARSLRVRGTQLDQVAEWTPHLLGQFHGHVYYNLVHWYRMVGIAPGYPLNRRVLEVALGVSESLDGPTARSLRPFRFATPVHRIVSRTVTSTVYVRRVLGIEGFVDRFLREFDEVYAEFDGIDYRLLDGAEVFRRFEEMERRLLDQWGPVMVLDAALLTLSGLLFATTRLLLPDAPEWFGFAAIAPGVDIESAEPAHALGALAARVAEEPETRTAVVAGTPAEAHARLLAEGPTWLREAVDHYVDLYGYRSPDELKLEIPDLHEDPSQLMGMIRSALSGGEPSRGPEATDYLDAHLHGVRRGLYDRLRGRVSRATAYRERVRFARTRAFGMVKRMVRAMGADLVGRGLLDHFDDVFLLRLDEIRSLYTEGAPDRADLDARIASRRRAREVAEGLLSPARFRTRGGAVTAGDLVNAGFVPLVHLPRAEPGHVLTGIASSTGTARGRVVVATEPTGADGGILVAHRTDPGWVTVLPTASALLIERGSPLTHVAIIAREMGIPTVVQIQGLTAALRSGMVVDVDATAGTVTVLDTAESARAGATTGRTAP